MHLSVQCLQNAAYVYDHELALYSVDFITMQYEDQQSGIQSDFCLMSTNCNVLVEVQTKSCLLAVDRELNQATDVSSHRAHLAAVNMADQSAAAAE